MDSPVGGGTSGLPRGDDVPEGFPADLAGRYQAPALVGQGGMGLVFSAHHAALDRPVAVKVLRSMDPDSRARERFEREARILAEHPHAALVPLLEADLRHDPPYLVLPWFEGGDLRARIAAHGAVPPGTTARIGARLARALAHLHSHGVLHRDVKPGNVLLDGLGDAFLADVGLGLVPGAARLTRTEMVVGTLRYLARELGEGRPHSPASDLFALGAVLVETTLGELGGPPFADVTATQARLRRIADPALRDLLLALLASVPERRPDSAATVAGELDRIERSDYTSRLSGGGRRPAASPDVFDLPTQAPLRLASVAVGNGEATSGAAAPVVGRSPVPVVAALAVLALVAGLGSGLGSGGNPSGSGSSAAVPVLPPARTLEPGGPWLRPPLGASGSPAPWLRERAMARGRGGNPVRAGSLGDREALLVVDRGQGELRIERHQAGGPESGELVARIEPDPGGERVAEVFLVDASGWLLTTRLPGGGEARLGDGSGRTVWSFRSPEPAFGAAAGVGNGRVEPLAFGSSGALLATGRELILVARDGTREARFLRPPDLEPLRVRATPEGFELAGDGRVYRFP